MRNVAVLPAPFIEFAAPHVQREPIHRRPVEGFGEVADVERGFKRNFRHFDTRRRLQQ